MKGEFIMPTNTVYLAGKMTGLTKEEMSEWRKVAALILSNQGFKVLDPMRFAITDHPDMTDREMVDNNKFMIRHSTVILAELNYDEVSIGTVGEIIFAREKLGLPVVVWGQSGKVTGHPWIREHVTKVFADLYEAIEYIVLHYKR